MKLLQITKNNKIIKSPKILEFGKDFEGITVWSGIEPHIVNFDYDNRDVEICQLSDCYQSRPLIEIDDFCEFDVIQQKGGEYGNGSDCHMWYDYKPYLFMVVYNKSIQDDFSCQNLGSIFLPENQIKYPELYQEALGLIK